MPLNTRHLLKSADCVHFHFSCGDLKEKEKKNEIPQYEGKRKQSAEIRGALEDALIKQSMKWVGVFVYYINNQFRFLVLFPK